MTPSVVIFMNMVTPYTRKLFDALKETVDLCVASCVRQEANRNWADETTYSFDHVILPGKSIKLAENRFAHVNTGMGRLLSQRRPDVVILNGFYPTMLFAALAAIRQRIPFLIAVDGWKESMPGSMYHRLIRPFMLRKSAGVITCSDKGFDYFLNCDMPADRIFKAPIAPAWTYGRPRLPFTGRSYDLLWAAQLNHTVKNAQFFLEVVEKLAVLLPGIRVRVVGAGPAEGDVLHRLSATGIAYDFDRNVPWSEMADIFEKSKILLLPSLAEPWGLVCNEAMLCGTPCMVSRHVGASDELVVDGENGMVDDLDADLWVRSLHELLGDQEAWERLSVNAMDQAAGRNLATYVAGFTRAIASAVRSPGR